MLPPTRNVHSRVIAVVRFDSRSQIFSSDGPLRITVASLNVRLISRASGPLLKSYENYTRLKSPAELSLQTVYQARLRGCNIMGHCLKRIANLYRRCRVVEKIIALKVTKLEVNAYRVELLLEHRELPYTAEQCYEEAKPAYLELFPSTIQFY